MDKKRICSICGKEFTGYGNNAEPVNDGTCCNECNFEVVIPRRMTERCGASSEESGKATDSVKDGKANGVASKKGCIGFPIESNDIKHRAVIEDMKLCMNCPGVECEEKRDKLSEETAKKLIDLARRKLDSRSLQCLSSDCIGYVGDDLDLTVQLCMFVTGSFPAIPEL